MSKRTEAPIGARAIGILSRGKAAVELLRKVLDGMEPSLSLIETPVLKEDQDRPIDLTELVQASLAAHSVLKNSGTVDPSLSRSILSLAEGLWMDREDLDSLAKGLEKAIGLEPSSDMTTEERRESQLLRSKKFGISPLEGMGERLTFPPNFPTDLEDYGDPVNLMYPCDTPARARNARVRFKQFADNYPTDKD